MAQGTIKIGVILPFSGQFADFATQMDNGIKLYMKQKGDTVAGKKIEIIRKDTGGVAPDVATRLAQELITRDNVDILAGMLLSPNAIAVSKVSAEAKKFMVIMNAATTVIITMSPYSVRASMTLPSVGIDRRGLGLQERHSQGLHDGVRLRAGQGRGSLLPRSLQGGGRRDRRLGAHAGGQSGLLRLRAARQGPQSGIDLHLRPGRRAAGSARQGVRGARRRRQKIKIIGTGEVGGRELAQGHGRCRPRHHHRCGTTTSTTTSKLNKEFVAAYNAEFKRNPDFGSVGGYDGMHVIYEALKKTGGKTDGDSLVAAAKGLSFESPRGPFQIDPDTRDIVQNISIRQVRKVDGGLRNVVIDKVEKVKDPGSAGKK